MNTKQLIVFREVMVTGSVSEAARNLHRTQPAISASIAALESDLGCKLFMRRSGRLHPVPEAYYLLEETREILERLSSTRQIMSSIRNLAHGSLHMVSMPGPSVILLPQMIGRFVQGRDDVQVTLITRNSLQVQRLVAAQKFDIGLADLGYEESVAPNLIRHEIFNYECVCALHSEDPLSVNEVITPMDLKGKPLAALFAEHPVYIRTRSAFAEMSVPFHPRFETQYCIPLLSFVELGLACAIVDPLSAESYRIYRRTNRAIVFRPFQPTVEFVVSVVTPQHRPLSILAKAFAETLTGELHGFGEVRNSA